MRRGKWPFSDLFGVRGWPNRANKGFDMFPMFLVFFVYLLTTFRPCFQPVLFSIFIESLIFYYKYNTTQHTTYTIHNHTRAHTCTPATDRDLESGLSKSVSVNTRKNLEK